MSVFHWQFLITYVFSVSLKVWSMLHHGPLGRVQGRERYFMFKNTFLTFFCCFSSSLRLYYLNFCFWWSINFLQEIVSETLWTCQTSDAWNHELLIAKLNWNRSDRNVLYYIFLRRWSVSANRSLTQGTR